MSSGSWEVRFSKSRQLPYFYDAESGKSTWEKPDSIPDDQVASLPGAHYLKPGGAVDGGANTAGKVRASHLLVKHNQSRRPSSWKEVRSVSMLFCPVLILLLSESHYSHARTSRGHIETTRTNPGLLPLCRRICIAGKSAFVRTCWMLCRVSDIYLVATAPRLPRAVTLASLAVGKCRNHLKTLLSV